MTQLNGDVESQNITSPQIHVNPEQTSNNVQNDLSLEVSNTDQQSQPERLKINELKERILIEWIKAQNVEISQRSLFQKS